jgi:phosphosulfolactate synthase (CoM biosynthesis protein A)
MKNKHLYITETQDCQIKQRAKETGLKQAEIIRRALDAYFDNDDDEWDRQMKRDLEAGRLDNILAKARKQYREGKYTEL